MLATPAPPLRPCGPSCRQTPPPAHWAQWRGCRGAPCRSGSAATSARCPRPPEMPRRRPTALRHSSMITVTQKKGRCRVMPRRQYIAFIQDASTLLSFKMPQCQPIYQSSMSTDGATELQSRGCISVQAPGKDRAIVTLRAAPVPVAARFISSGTTH
jgi:hypothetical protein